MRAQRSSVTRGTHMRSDPGGEFCVRHLTCREPKHRHRRIDFGRLELRAVQPQEHEQRSEAGSLVTIDKRMVAHDADRICRRQFGDVRIVVACTIERPRKGALQEPLLAHARGTAMFGKLFVVDRDDELA